MIENVRKLSCFEENIFHHAEELSAKYGIDENVVAIIMLKAVRLTWQESTFITHEISTHLKTHADNKAHKDCTECISLQKVQVQE